MNLGKLYLVATTIFLILGSALGVAMRLELLTPAGDLVDATTYEDLFIAHGRLMLHLFLLPLFPAVLGNLLGM
ncbi:MAG: cytochrome c oxidase subunit I, partial [bacterium]|nr:cytochrome c oxidase subunit I [bacterium]